MERIVIDKYNLFSLPFSPADVSLPNCNDKGKTFDCHSIFIRISTFGEDKHYALCLLSITTKPWALFWTSIQVSSVLSLERRHSRDNSKVCVVF